VEAGAQGRRFFYMVAKLETVNPTSITTSVIRVFTSANRSVEADAAVERQKLPPPDRNDAIKIAAQMTADLQDKLDKRQDLKTLPIVDPDRTTDPSLGEFLFWEVVGPDTFLVSREGVVTVTWDGAEYIPSWRQARRS